jgi:hypothetical protein
MPNSFDPTMNAANRIDFESKDALPASSDAKRVMGVEFHEEFSRIIHDFSQIKTELDKLYTAVGTASELFASLTHGGGQENVSEANDYASVPLPAYSNNIKKVSWPTQSTDADGQPSWRFCRVEFLTPLAESALGYPPNPPNGAINAAVNIQVTPFSSNNNSLGVAGFVNTTVTNIDQYGCEIAFYQPVIEGGIHVNKPVWFQAFCLLVAVNSDEL